MKTILGQVEMWLQNIINIGAFYSFVAHSTTGGRGL